MDGSDAFLELSSEEFGKGLIMSEVWVFNLLHVDSVEFGKATIEDVSEWHWKPQRAEPPSQSRDVSGDGHDVLNLFIFLQGFVYLIEGEEACEDHAEEVVDVVLPGHAVFERVEHLSWNRHLDASLWGESGCLCEHGLSKDSFDAEEEKHEEAGGTHWVLVLSGLKLNDGIVQVVGGEVFDETDWSEGEFSNYNVLYIILKINLMLLLKNSMWNFLKGR